MNARKNTAIAKIRRIRSILKWVQDKLGAVASAMERASNNWNWTEPRVTAILSLFGLQVCDLLSSRGIRFGFVEPGPLVPLRSCAPPTCYPP